MAQNTLYYLPLVHISFTAATRLATARLHPVCSDPTSMDHQHGRAAAPPKLGPPPQMKWISGERRLGIRKNERNNKNRGHSTAAVRRRSPPVAAGQRGRWRGGRLGGGGGDLRSRPRGDPGGELGGPEQLERYSVSKRRFSQAYT
jgi:hypothetical protein